MNKFLIKPPTQGINQRLNSLLIQPPKKITNLSIKLLNIPFINHFKSDIKPTTTQKLIERRIDKVIGRRRQSRGIREEVKQDVLRVLEPHPKEGTNSQKDALYHHQKVKNL